MSKSVGCRYCIVPEASLARLWIVGSVDRETQLAALSMLRGDPLWHENTDVIWDCSGVSEVVIDPTGLEEVLEALLDEPEGMDLFYGSQDDVYVIAKLFATLERRRGKRARVCKTMAEVLDALDCTSLPEALRDAADEADGRQRMA